MSSVAAAQIVMERLEADALCTQGHGMFFWPHLWGATEFGEHRGTEEALELDRPIVESHHHSLVAWPWRAHLTVKPFILLMSVQATPLTFQRFAEPVSAQSTWHSVRPIAAE